MTAQQTKRLRFSVSLVTQGRHKFFTLTMPSDILARTTYVTNREDDPIKGFQRVLDKDRAQQIAAYIDSGLGTIPNSIVLSAQPEADVKVIGGKTIEFTDTPKAFLVIDGQHRVYGFSLAKTHLRVPVVIYNNLSRTDEAKLFIDINTKQRPVPNELLLDIKKLAEYESDWEQLFGELFDKFNTDPSSPLLGRMSPQERARGKLSRVTFNAALKPLTGVIGDLDVDRVYEILRDYLAVIVKTCSAKGVPAAVTNPVLFRAVLSMFPEIAERVHDRYDGKYSEASFEQVLEPALNKLKKATLQNPGNSVKAFRETVLNTLKQSFSLG